MHKIGKHQTNLVLIISKRSKSSQYKLKKEILIHTIKEIPFKRRKSLSQWKTSRWMNQERSLLCKRCHYKRYHPPINPRKLKSPSNRNQYKKRNPNLQFLHRPNLSGEEVCQAFGKMLLPWPQLRVQPKMLGIQSRKMLRQLHNSSRKFRLNNSKSKNKEKKWRELKQKNRPG